MANTVIRKIPSLTRVDNERMMDDIRSLVRNKCKDKVERVAKDVAAELKSKKLTVKSMDRGTDSHGAQIDIRFEGGMTYMRKSTEPTVSIKYEGESVKIPIEVKVYCDGYLPVVSIRCELGFKGLNEIKHFISYLERKKR